MDEFLKANPSINLEQLKQAVAAQQGANGMLKANVGTITHGQLGQSSYALGSQEQWARGDDIHCAASEGKLELVLALVEKDTTLLESVDDEGRTALHWASDRGHDKMVKGLLAKQANVKAMDAEGQTPLHYAVACEFEEIAKMLVISRINLH